MAIQGVLFAILLALSNLEKILFLPNAGVSPGAYLSGVLQHHLLIALSALIAACSSDRAVPLAAATRVVPYRQISVILVGALGAFVAASDAIASGPGNHGLRDLAWNILTLQFSFSNILFVAMAAAFVFAAIASEARADANQKITHPMDREDNPFRPSTGVFLLLLFANVIAGVLFWTDASVRDVNVLEALSKSDVSTPLDFPLEAFTQNFCSAAAYVISIVISVWCMSSLAIRTQRILVDRRPVPAVARTEENPPPLPEAGLFDGIVSFFVGLFYSIAAGAESLGRWIKSIGNSENSKIKTGESGKRVDGPDKTITSEPEPPGLRLAVRSLGWVAVLIVGVLAVFRDGPLTAKCELSQGCVTVYFATPRYAISPSDPRVAEFTSGYVETHTPSGRASNWFDTKAGANAHSDDRQGPFYLGKAFVEIKDRKTPKREELSEERKLKTLLKSHIREEAESRDIEVTSIFLDPGSGFDRRSIESHTTFFKDLSHAATSRTENEKLLLFVHGFDTTFERSVADAAKYAVDLGWQLEGTARTQRYPFGPPVLFSWPTTELGENAALAGLTGGSSAVISCLAKFKGFAGCGVGGSLVGVIAGTGGKLVHNYEQALNKRSSDAAVYLKELLYQIFTNDALRDVKEVNVMAFSMGNHVFSKALYELCTEYKSELVSRSNSLVFRIASTSGDTDYDTFGDAIAQCGETIDEAEVYASRSDIALMASGAFNSLFETFTGKTGISDRLGRPYDDETALFTFNNVESSDLRTRLTIDVSNFVADESQSELKQRFVGSHTYPTSHPAILADTACYFAGFSFEERFLEMDPSGLPIAHPRRDWNNDPDTRSECRPIFREPFQCDVFDRNLIVRGWFRIRSLFNPDLRQDWSDCDDAKFEELYKDENIDRQELLFPKQILKVTPGVSGSFSNYSFVCSSEDVMVPKGIDVSICEGYKTTENYEEEAIASGKALSVREYVSRISDICETDAVVVIAGESNSGRDAEGSKSELSRKRVDSITDIVKESVSTCANNPNVIRVALGKRSCVSECEDSPADRQAQVILLKRSVGISSADGEDVSVDLFLDELGYAVTDPSNFIEPVQSFCRAENSEIEWPSVYVAQAAERWSDTPIDQSVRRCTAKSREKVEYYALESWTEQSEGDQDYDR